MSAKHRITLAATAPDAGMDLEAHGLEPGEVMVDVRARSRGWASQSRMTWISISKLDDWVAKLGAIARDAKGDAPLDCPPGILVRVMSDDGPELKATVWLSEAAKDEPATNKGEIQFRLGVESLRAFVGGLRSLLAELRKQGGGNV